MVDQVLGDLLPAGAAVALSPIPIVAIVLVLHSPGARVNGPAFAVGWVAGLAVVSALVVVIFGWCQRSRQQCRRRGRVGHHRNRSPLPCYGRRTMEEAAPGRRATEDAELDGHDRIRLVDVVTTPADQDPDSPLEGKRLPRWRIVLTK